MQKRMLVFLLGAGLIGLFVIFSYVVHKDIFTQFDFDTTVRLQDKISRRFDPFFSWFSELGSFEVSVILLLIVIALIRKLPGLMALVLFVGFHLIEIFGKTMVEHLPPPQFLLRTKQMVDFPQFHVRAEYSYPSGHSGRTLFISILFAWWIYRSKKFPLVGKLTLWIGIVLYDVIMLISRIYLGEHWTSDVLGGALLGIALGLINLVML